MRTFVETLAWCSEKAAHLARACRKEKDLFKLLVEEKETSDREGAFAQDFKTLADVLIQETVRYDLSKTYPDLADNILGEESNEFTNTLGEKIKVRVCETQEETSKLLYKVLDGHQVAADILAKEVHANFSDTETLLGNASQLPDQSDIESHLGDLGIWIDPIDGTNQYITGREGQPARDPLQKRGLGVVTVLIGVFNRKTGVPVAGVVNQPFVDYNEESQTWTGKVHWGISIGESRFFSSGLDTSRSTSDDQRRPKAVISCREPESISLALENSGFDIVFAAGAGYKILLVVLGCVDIYVTTKTYKWDTCAGDAILNSLGGGLMDLKTGQEVIYHQPGEEEGAEPWANVGLIVAYRSKELLEKLQPLQVEADKMKEPTS